jgi:putative peptidoglycan lipid II flippase
MGQSQNSAVKSESSFVNTAGSVSVAIMISRLLGLIRDVIQAQYFGAGKCTDALMTAQRVPNLLRDLFAEGALSSAFVPTFVRCLTLEGKERAWQLANRVISVLLVVLAALTLVFFLGARWFVYLLAAGFADIPGKFELTVQMTRILSPFLLFVALASVLMGILNACGTYFIPAMASSAFNICCIAGGVLLSPLMPRWGIEPVVSMAIGALVGGASQFLVMTPSARRSGYRFRFDLNFSDSGLQHIARLMVPAIIGLSATQINILVDSQLASRYGDGPVSWLNYGFRLMQFPIGVLGIAIATVSMTAVSVAIAKKENAKLQHTIFSSLRLAACLTFPATVGLILFREEIVRLIFERRHFLPADTVMTSKVVLFYALSLFSYSAVKILVPTFYALEDTRTPVLMSAITVAGKIMLNFAMLFLLPLGFLGLALATTAAAWLNFILLMQRFRKRTGIALDYFELRQYLRIAMASLIMGLASWIAYRGCWMICTGPSWPAQAFRLLIAILTGIMVFFPLLRSLKVEEGSDILRLASGILGKFR